MPYWNRTEKGITIAGVLVIVIWMCFLFIYQYKTDEKQVIPDSDVIPVEAGGTLSGYEEENDLVAYMLFQIENQNLDYGLRGCATEELAKYFSMTCYLQYTEQYPDLDLIPPADYNSPAYEAISVARLSEDYAVMLEQMFRLLEPYGHLELLSAEEDIPENPDGKYYEKRGEICDVLGARSIREIQLLVQTDSGPVEMHWTLARYRKFWKLLLFSSLEEYSMKDVKVTEQKTNETALQGTNMKETDILPCNYRFVNDCSGEDPEEVVRQFLLYLQKQDVWSALTYYYLYEQVPKVERAYFSRLNQAAIEIQEWLYRMFLPTGEQQAWYMRNMQERAEELLKELSTAQMIYVDYDQFEILENNGGSLTCRMEYSYNRGSRWIAFHMVYQDGWKINDITITGWKQIGEDWYYLDDMGVMQTGWQKINETWYYLDKAGIMQTDWQKIDGKWYYLGEDGSMRRYWKCLDEKWYFFGSDGAMRKYWLKDGAIWYYLGTNGIMQTGWQEIDGTWYYLDEETGAMAANTRIDGYYVNSDGEWIPGK